MKRMNAQAAMEAAARALETWGGEDLARQDALAVYDAAVRMLAARWSSPLAQVDDRIPVPDHVAQFETSAEIGGLAIDEEKETLADFREWPMATKLTAETIGRLWAQQMLLNEREVKPTIAVVYRDVAGLPCVVRIEAPAT